MFPIGSLNILIGQAIPMVFDQSMSWLELLGAVVAKVNELITASNAYFTVDLQTYVTNILTAWQDDGTLDTIISEALQTEIDLVEVDVLAVKALARQTFVNVKDVGAVGDGATDDTAAIQAAIDTYKNIFIPAGVYIVTQITIGHSQSIRGAGIGLSTLKLKANTNTTMLNVRDAYDTLITDLTLDGNKAENSTDTTGSVMFISASAVATSNCQLTNERIYIVNGGNNGISTVAPRAAGEWNWVYLLNNISVKLCKGYGLYDQTTDNHYSNFHIQNCDKAGMFLDHCANNLYVNFKVDTNGWNSVSPSGNYTTGANIIMEGCVVCQLLNIDCQSGYFVGLRMAYVLDCIINISVDHNGARTVSDETIVGIGVIMENSDRNIMSVIAPLIVGTYQVTHIYVAGSCDNNSIMCESQESAKITNGSTTTFVGGLSSLIAARAAHPVV